MSRIMHDEQPAQPRRVFGRSSTDKKPSICASIRVESRADKSQEGNRWQNPAALALAPLAARLRVGLVTECSIQPRWVKPREARGTATVPREPGGLAAASLSTELSRLRPMLVSDTATVARVQRCGY